MLGRVMWCASEAQSGPVDYALLQVGRPANSVTTRLTILGTNHKEYLFLHKVLR